MRQALFGWAAAMRLRFHFLRVLVALHVAPTPKHTPRTARLDTLRCLRDYAIRGDFPQHGGTGAPRPVFVDHRGTHCAVGHLLACRGYADAVHNVVRTHNYSRVPALMSLPGIAPALEQVGLTPREAAQVQPTYAALSPCYFIFGLQLLAFALSFVPIILFLKILPGSRSSASFGRKMKPARVGKRVLVLSLLGLLLGVLVFPIGRDGETGGGCGYVWSSSAWLAAARYTTGGLRF